MRFRSCLTSNTIRPFRSVRADILHIGPVGDQPGGMAQVIRTLVKGSSPDVPTAALASLRYAHDPLSPLLTARVVIALVVRSVIHRRGAVCIHLSEKGSFLREGALVLGCRMLRLNCFAFIHGANFDSFAAAHPRVVRWSLRQATGILCLTSETIASLEKCRVSRPIHLIRNPVEVPENVDGSKNWIVFAGEIGDRKGADVLFRAWENVESGLPNWELFVIGPPPTGMILPTIERMTFLGALPNDQTKRVIGESKLAVLPSRAEALPIFLLESMAAGVAPIGSNVGSIPWLLSENSGIVVEAGSIASLTAAMLRMCTDDELRSEIARNARIRAQREFDSKSVVADFERLLLDES